MESLICVILLLKIKMEIDSGIYSGKFGGRIMYIGDVEIGKEYILNYDKPKIVKALNCDAVGDCTIQFKNNKKDVYHCSLLEEIKE